MSDAVELCDYLAHYVNPEYRWVRLHECIYREKEDTLTAIVLFDERLNQKMNNERKIDLLKSRFEEDFRTAVIEHVGSCGLKYRFIYKQSYLDKTSLEMKLRQFLTTEFTILTLAFGDEDLRITSDDNNEVFTVNLFMSKQAVEYIKNSKNYNKYIQTLHNDYFCTINVYFNEKPASASEDTDDDFLAIERYFQENANVEKAGRVDKTMKVRNIEYWLGKPIQQTPVKAAFLRVSGDEQVIAGAIRFLTKKEFKRTDKDGNEVEGHFFKFVLDDGKDRVQCVFFQKKWLNKFETLTNDTVVCAVGINESRNGYVSFKVLGISFCEIV